MVLMNVLFFLKVFFVRMLITDHITDHEKPTNYLLTLLATEADCQKLN